ncbi:peptidoglycan DD-metalloendopeptidase family protein [bacterium]|nr:peptidoglycan DD-metalloendopeptidase family protein [bacterium]
MCWIRVFLCVCISLYSSLVFASPDFIWPLQQNYGISATFGESRDDHYHAGIDLSTNGETGLPVLAVADGSIYRMKIQKRGYGKALYIQHADGMQSVYAHLEDFSRELGLHTIYVDRANREGTPYVGDIFLDPPLRVKQGQVVAYSGESGAGLPHLHLEIRKNESVALNPLTNGFRDTLDPIPPTFQACYFYPLSIDSAINGDLDTKEIRLRRSDSVFVPDSTPVVRGDFVLSVSLYDSALRRYHRAPQRITYSIDDKVLYSIEFNQFSYTQPQGFGLLYDLGKPGPSYYEYPILLAKTVEESLPFVTRSVSFSTRTLSAGNHRLRIEAGDSNNNTSIADIPFVVNHPPQFDLHSIQPDQAELAVHATIRDPNWKGSGALTGEVEYSLDDGKSFIPVTLTSLEVPDANDSLKFRYRIPMSEARNARSVLIRARAYDGIEYSPYVFGKIRPGGAPIPDTMQTLSAGNLRYETYGDTIRVIFEMEEPATGKLQASIGDPPAFFPLLLREPTSMLTLIPAPKRNEDMVVALPGGQSLTVPVRFVKRGTQTLVADGNFQLSFNENSLYKDAFVWTKSLPEYKSKSLPLIGPMLQLAPRGLPLKKGTTLSFSYPETVKHPEKLSIYHWNRASQKWESLPSQLNKSSRSVQTKIETFDLYALISDNAAPAITSIFPRKRSATRNPTPLLAVQIRDAGMDVDDEKVTLYVDSIPYQAEYDPDRNTARAKITKPLKKGYHKFFAVAYDYAGNRSQSSPVSFRVK